MTVRCIYGARFSMTAEVLRYDTTYTPDTTDVSTGPWSINQDPVTGEIVTNWVPGKEDNPSTTDVDEAVEHVIVPCFTQGIYNSGIRASGADERFGAEYFNIEFVKMWVPAGVKISKRDRVTNIKDSLGNPVWVDEEYLDGTRSTVFNVQGVTPRMDAWNRPVDQFILLEKTA